MSTLAPPFLIGFSSEYNHKISDGFKFRNGQPGTVELAALERLEKSL